MFKRQYVLALLCYLAIPAVVIAGGALYSLIDPEMARGHADYVRDYRLLDMVRRGALLAAGGLALLLWIACCHLLLKSRHRSPGWLLLAPFGAWGFIVLSMLEDRSPAPDDIYQRFIRRLKMHWRVVLESAVFMSAWTLAYELMVIKRELMIRYQSWTTGTPVETIVAEQLASSGMWSFSEGLQVMYFVVLLYLLWPVVFNFAARWSRARYNAIRA